MYNQRANNPNFYSRRQQNWSRNQNSVAYVSSIKFGPVMQAIGFALVVLVLGLIYLVQATRVSVYDRQTASVESQISEINKQKNDLEIENARLSSLENTKNSPVASAMVSPAAVDYAD